MAETITGIVQDTTYRNEQNGYTVLRIATGRIEYTITGVMPQLGPGENVMFTGTWVEHPVYGQQFSAQSCTIATPEGEREIVRYLASGLIHGIGQSTAVQIVKAFGDETLEILDEHPERLVEVPGIGKKKMAMIAESYAEQIAMRRTVVFLQNYGFSSNMISRITNRYHGATIALLQENPYRMVSEIDGIGFLTADRMALSMGVSSDSEFRLQAALYYLLNEAANSGGHTFLPKDELIAKAVDMLRVPQEMVSNQLHRLLLDKKLLGFETSDYPEAIGLPVFFYTETEIAYRLQILMQTKSQKKMDSLLQRIGDYEQDIGITFSSKQREAIASAVQQGVFVITGGPGTGKTTMLRCIIQLLSEETEEITLCAPTGRAAKRMSEASGWDAMTIHRLLVYNGKEGEFEKNEEHPLDAECVIVDEMSMVDALLMRSLLRALRPGTKLIMVGDADQLPSVGAGNVLEDILGSGTVPYVQLTDIFRQDESSMIVLNAHRINRGEMPVLRAQNTDFFFERKAIQSAAAVTVTQLIKERLPRYLHLPANDIQEIERNIQVLSPTKKGDCGSYALNKQLQNALNPETGRLASVVHGNTEFRTGDKVIQIKNDYQLEYTKETEYGLIEKGTGVFNGDIGYIESVDASEHMVTVRFDDDRLVVYHKNQLDELELGYCLTVHKSQGSEFPVVVIPVVSGPPLLMARNLLYTAITRARKLVVLVGKEEAIEQMVSNDHIAKRYTTLKQRLMAIEQ